MTAALFPSTFGEIEVRFGAVDPVHAVYVRRRLLVGLVFAALFVVLSLGVHTVLANRGGVPASTPTIRPATAQLLPDAAPIAMPVVPTPSALTYIIQPGDSLWNLAERFHAGHALSGYVDALVRANGGTVVHPGQVLVLP